MTHHKFTEKISLWLDDELSSAEVAELQMHLSECAACRQMHQTMRQMDGFLRKASAVMVEPQPGFSTRFETRLAQQQDLKRWRIWAGVGVLLIGTLVLITLAAVAGGVLTLIGTGIVLPDLRLVYEWLGVVGGIVNQIRAYLNLGGAVFKFILFAMSQPLFWGYVVVAVALTGSWLRVMHMLYRRTPVTVALVV